MTLLQQSLDMSAHQYDSETHEGNPLSIWQQCCDYLKSELAASDFNTWINPLQAEVDSGQLVLWAPNRFVLEWVNEQYLPRIKTIISQYVSGDKYVDDVVLRIGSKAEALKKRQSAQAKTNVKKDDNATNNTHSSHKGAKRAAATNGRSASQEDELPEYDSNLNPNFTFENFVEGKANQLARAAAFQVSENPGKSYNPFFMYGGVGLGKTHLMHAIGNLILNNNPSANVLYLHSERFVADMVKALQRNLITNFKQFYRSVDVLLLDDIQFFANKDRSQEEFFHTFNALLDGHQQIILTSDRYPKEIEGVEERLKSRLGWGLTVAIEPPELETRVAILMRKAEQSGVELPHEVAFFIAKQIQSNVRDLEGALKRVIANAQFTGKAITVEFARYALQDLLTAQAKMVTVENIQKTVAEYYKIKVADMLSKRRTRVIARPRQMAMALAKELTNNSLPEIGDSFGGRDHTTVLHACRKVYEALEQDMDLKEDWDNLSRILSC